MSLEKQNRIFSRDIPVGIMSAVPGALLGITMSRILIVVPMSDLDEMILVMLLVFGFVGIVVFIELSLLNLILWYMPWTWIRTRRITEVLFFITFVGFAFLLFLYTVRGLFQA